MIHEQKSLFQIWWLAIRPRTLSAAASGVVMGSALAWADGSFLFAPSFFYSLKNQGLPTSRRVVLSS